MKQVLIIVFFICTLTYAGAQKLTPEQYIAQYKDLAIREMKRMGVPAAITLAQGLLETESGNSELLKKSNNHFGIKCKNTWTASGVRHDDDAPGECFRQYKTAEDSYRDHSNFLRGSTRYAILFKLKPDDYRAWANGLKNAGYATNPQYPVILIRNIEQYDLNQYTLSAIKDVPVFNGDAYPDDVEEKGMAEPRKDKTETPVLTVPDKVSSEIIEKNGRKSVYAKKGTSILAIATQRGIGLLKLMEYNNWKKDGLLDSDQWVYLEKERNGKKDASALKYHAVEAGEVLFSLSRKFNVSVTQLKDWNHLESDNLVVGQQLIVGK